MLLASLWIRQSSKRQIAWLQEDPSLMFSIVKETRDQTQPGSLLSRLGGKMRDPGNEVEKVFRSFSSPEPLGPLNRRRLSLWWHFLPGPPHPVANHWKVHKREAHIKQANQKQRSLQTVSWLVGSLTFSLRKSENTPGKIYTETTKQLLRQFLYPK